jgi:hypothetical protein
MQVHQWTDLDAIPGRPVLIADSVTSLATTAADAIVVCGSHGGLYPARVAARAGVAAIVLHDASVGRDGAGIAGIAYLDRLGIAGAAIGHETARIGDGADCLRRGRIAHVNTVAAAFGCRVGQSCREALAALRTAVASGGTPPDMPESRFPLVADGVRVWALDSAALVEPGDQGQIVVTGSHGGLLGGSAATAIKAEVAAALFNDAGIGIDGAGVSRLAALEARGIAAGAVMAASARIGDARSTYQDGLLSTINPTARHHGVAVGMTARAFVSILRAAVENREAS